ncbi:S-adenosyl-L-methionine-dependent methyltransferase [Rozella allomycis CSF55]|uniref:rRNA methyltransferase 2, mitochondrial n=1 Tax=Rozella allomycis (strain CSF55) TaxID=988480 RepID=A0A075ANC6_ROZAC|nr:Ribosomal RNA methyltransferase FtsJ domain-containing protein [Rozella allomycis CSF55]RKP21297.1 S-adenosyl-L-methionine-dependent methyltransferase [Rozella allomycis CSF55]|eukprot:EPZ31345.1 Ribosomal RNA methyltransferase FtsJ domain-containing protein [Rozella allomycis CSF55]
MHEMSPLINPGDAVLDLGCAPGSWCQVAEELVGPKGIVVGVDRVYVPPLTLTRFIVGDATLPSIQKSIREQLIEKEYFDVVLSDMCPNLIGIKSADHQASLNIVNEALKIAHGMLKENGTLLVKIVKPPASKKESAEIYIRAEKFHPLNRKYPLSLI